MTQSVDERDEQAPAAGTVRRRLGPPPGEDDRSGRTGCLVTGGLLGVIFGIMFALYGLKPILQYFYGEETVEPGVEYRDDGIALAFDSFVVGAESPAGDTAADGTTVVAVDLHVEAIEAWEPAPADMRLEVSSQDEWVVARPPASVGGHDFAAGDNRTVTLYFWVPAANFEVEALHIADPRLKMLPP